MKNLILLLLFCQVVFAVKHSLKYTLTFSYGVRSNPEFMAAAVVDDVTTIDCDSNRLTPEAKTDWMDKFFKDKPDRLMWYNDKCTGNQKDFRYKIKKFMERFNHTGGVHVFQRKNGCEWDDETGIISGFNQYGYDGEDVLIFDTTTLTWIAPKPQALITKHEWDSNDSLNRFWKDALYNVCIEYLKEYVDYAKSFSERTVFPLVFLLQKTPSSPVSCHATGFYPDRAEMFWRKDGEELHEDVDHGEILPNNDGTFQMSVDLKLSSVKPEDWGRYDCVFQLSGVKDDIVTKLDKAVIRTNSVPPSEFPVAVTGVVVGLLLLAVCITGLFMWRRNNNGFIPANSSDPETL